MWYLENNGIRKTLADWGINLSTSFSFRGLAGDTLKLSTNDDFDAAFKFSYNSRAIIWKDDLKWFDGFVIPASRLNDTGRIHHQFTLMNWVWFAQREIFRQDWKQFAGWTKPGDASTPPTFTIVVNSDVVLGENPAEGFYTNGQQIVEALTLLNEIKNPTRQGTGGDDATKDILQIGAIDPQVYFAKTPARDQMVLEVLRDMLRHTPTAVFATDYSSSPPTVNVPDTGSQPVVAINYNTKNITQLSLKSRDDLDVNGVVIKYKKTSTVDGRQTASWGVDKYPAAVNELLDNIVFLSVDLQGFSVTNVSTTIQTDPINATSGVDADRLAWWQAHDPRLKSERIVNGTLKIDPATVVVKDDTTNLNLTDLTGWYEFVPGLGQIMPWQNAQVKKVTITGKGSWKRNHSTLNQQVEEKSSQDIHARITICTINTSSLKQKFSSANVTGTDEEVPPGIAQSYFNDLNTLQFEGNCGLVGVDVDGDVAVGKRAIVNTPNGNYGPLLIQSVEGDLGNGKTSFSFGPPNILGLSDRVEFAKVTRTRQNRLPSGRSDASPVSSGADVDLSTNSDASGTIPGFGDTAEFNFVQNPALAADRNKPATVDVDTNTVASLAAGVAPLEAGTHDPQNVKMIRLATCDPETGTRQYRIIPAGGAHTLT